MPDSIEAKIHNILLDIDPANNDYEQQSVIVAEAAANFRLATNKSRVRKASKEEEAVIIDCILQAMNNLAEHDNARYAYVNERLFDVEDAQYDFNAIIDNLRISSDMNVLNDSDLDVFFNDDEDKNNLLFDISDGCERHPSDVYSFEGRKKHRSDFIG